MRVNILQNLRQSAICEYVSNDETILESILLSKQFRQMNFKSLCLNNPAISNPASLWWSHEELKAQQDGTKVR